MNFSMLFCVVFVVFAKKLVYLLNYVDGSITKNPLLYVNVLEQLLSSAKRSVLVVRILEEIDSIE